MEKKDFYENIKNQISGLSMSNILVIFVFFIALIFFIVGSIKYGIESILKKDDTIEEVVSYDYSSSASYSQNSEDEKYKTILVDYYATFFTIDDIEKVVLKSIYEGEYEKVYNIFSDDYKKQFSSKNEAFEHMKTFLDDNFDTQKIYSNDALSDEMYSINNSNIYICYLKNQNDELVKIVLNIDFSTETYTIVSLG